MFHPDVDRSGISPVHCPWPGEGVILRNVDKFDSVEVPELIHSVGPGGFVAEGYPFITLLECHLLWKGEIHGFCAHSEHLINFGIDTVILQTVNVFQRVRREKLGEAAVLPKPEGGCCVPELLNLGHVTLDKLLVIYHKGGVSRDVFWERGQNHGG